MLFYSVVLGAIGPVLAFAVPPIRERLGYRPPEPIPTTYPSASPPLSPHTQMLMSFVLFVCLLDWWWQFRSGRDGRCRVMRMKSEPLASASTSAFVFACWSLHLASLL